MARKILLAGLLLLLPYALNAQSAPAPVVGWYNGNWQSGIPGLANWYHGRFEYSRVYDAFVVPEGGWAVAGVFSNNHMDAGVVTKAAWQIRRDMSARSRGKVVAGGVSRAVQTEAEGSRFFAEDEMMLYRIEVDGLHVALSPGKYWLSVAPVTHGQSFADATRDADAVAKIAGDGGMAFFESSSPGRRNVAAEMVGNGGELGVAKAFSQGVLILKASR